MEYEGAERAYGGGGSNLGPIRI